MPPRFWDSQDTIVARASAPGGAARGVIRVSGPDAVRIVSEMCDPADALGGLRHPTSVNVNLRLERLRSSVPAEALVWPDQRSYTRQPSVELHTMGAPPMLESILAAFVDGGARTAEPGEFTLRAFLAGRLDLTQAEAVLGVIDASGDEDLATALEQLAGGLTTPLDKIRNLLLDLLAHLEAGLDFADEDIEFISVAELNGQLIAAQDELHAVQQQLNSRHDSAELPTVVLCGPPNVGKSSLFNALLNRDASIVSEMQGATRDYVGHKLKLGANQSCLLIDTAGAAPAAAGSDALAQKAAQSVLERAAIRLQCREQAELSAVVDVSSTIQVVTKSDLSCDGGEYSGDSQHDGQVQADATDLVDVVVTSAETGEGVAELRRRIGLAIQAVSTEASRQGLAARCGESLRLASDAIERAREACENSAGEELVAAEIRFALDELGRVVGVIYNNDVLDRVFSRFCIGK